MLKFQQDQPLSHDKIFIGVTGGTAAGKTTICEMIQKNIEKEYKFTLIGCDYFYKDLDHSKIIIEDYNFDHPDALDWDVAYEAIKTLLSGKSAKVPVYSFVKHARTGEYIELPTADIIIIEGIFALWDKRIRDMMNIKIFIECDEDIRVLRRIQRDVKERGRTVDSVIAQYKRFVKVAFDDYIQPMSKICDIILPNNRENYLSIKVVIEKILLLGRKYITSQILIKSQLYFSDLILQLNPNYDHKDKLIFCKDYDKIQDILFQEVQGENQYHQFLYNIDKISNIIRDQYELKQNVLIIRYLFSNQLNNFIENTLKEQQNNNVKLLIILSDWNCIQQLSELKSIESIYSVCLLRFPEYLINWLN